MASFIQFENVEKCYGTGAASVRALHDATFTVERGEICVIVGPSGAGKTTLLNILGGMDTLTSGRVFLDGREVSAFNRRQLADYRRRDIGFVFQFYNLIPNLTALENVEIASQIVKDPLPAADVLRDVGLGDTGKQILALLQKQSRENGMTVIIITHNSALTAMADRVIHIKNGTVQSMAVNEKPVPVEEIEW